MAWESRDVTTCRKMIYIGGGRDIVETLAKSIDLGIEIHYIQKSEKYNPGVEPYIQKAYCFDFEDFRLLERFGREIFSQLGSASVFTLNESSLAAAAYLRHLLNLPGNSIETTNLLLNKMEMRRVLNRNNFSFVKFREGQSENDILEFFNCVRAPIILKPKNESGSFSVYKIQSESQISNVFRAMQENRIYSFLMEEFLEGPEISVEAFSNQGVHHVLSVTEKIIMPNFVEIGHVVPGRNSSELQMDLATFVSDFLKIVGIQYGPTHTEVRVTKKGFFILESHDRTGGDRINELVYYARGLDMKKLAFRQAMGMELTELFEFSKQVDHLAAAIVFLAPQQGQLRSINGVEQAKSVKGIKEVLLYVREGDIIGPIRDSLDRAGFVIACGETPNIAYDRAKMASELIQFEYS